MRETERQIFNQLCVEYSETLLIRGRLIFLFPKEDCYEKLFDKMSEHLEILERRMAYYLLGDDNDV
ncbi:hypothetical protein [Methanobrevibacter olleyae]|uniref:Uncharacterized protein n=1 Tax=Methanobrevibacter olleyae TaxID=294671 RepID=A0A126R1N4_METOL|nr:hypothetical protein [Methanobrevibacter olleyae]AMK16303.1 hypothetical protein YLM1_1748 [Methanobrevibacter olleyae]